MSAADKSTDSELERAVDIVAAYVSHNSLRASDLPDLIATVHNSLRSLAQSGQAAPGPTADVPAVPIKKSVTKDFIVCLEDGKKFKSLRRHLSSFHNMTPEQYRTKWGLPSDHPMVAPSYSATRSQLAKDSGLGLVARDEEAEKISPEKVASNRAGPAADVKKPGRGRPKKGS